MYVYLGNSRGKPKRREILGKIELGPEENSHRRRENLKETLKKQPSLGRRKNTNSSVCVQVQIIQRQTHICMYTWKIGQIKLGLDVRSQRRKKIRRKPKKKSQKGKREEREREQMGARNRTQKIK